MDHVVCLNTNSFPANSAKDAYQLLNDSLQGLLALNSGSDRYLLYYDDHTQQALDEFMLSQGYSYFDFKEALKTQHEHDMFLFLAELDDKSPAMDNIDDETIENIANYSFYIPGHCMENNGDIFGISWFLQAIMLSIPTDKRWDQHNIAIARTADDGRYIHEKLSLKNIARRNHGQILFNEFHLVNILEVCDACVLTQDFIGWYDNLTDENQNRVIDKLRLSSERNFNGGEPLFKTLTDSDGMREIRFSAYPGGAIRILFKPLKSTKQAILLGFIKKSNDDGYAEKIPKAKSLFESL